MDALLNMGQEPKDKDKAEREARQRKRLEELKVGMGLALDIFLLQAKNNAPLPVLLFHSSPQRWNLVARLYSALKLVDRHD